MEEGEAMGIFNATTAIASVVSAIAAGQLADRFGFAVVPVVAAMMVVASIVLAIPLLTSRHSSGKMPTPSQ
jgi:predicted MFS family arabinose efflux permease